MFNFSLLYDRFLKVVLILFLIGFAAYFNSIPHPFVHDDVVFIQNNQTLGDWDDVPSLFLRSSTTDGTISIVNSYYRPLLDILYKIQYALFGFDPHGYHLFNVLLHIANSILVYRLILLLLKCHFDSNGKVLLHSPQALAFCTAIFFLIHPVQSEAVACIAGVSNLIFVFFCLLSLICYLKAGQKEFSGYGIWWYAAALIFFLAALFSKEQAVMLPLLAGLLQFCFLGEFGQNSSNRGRRFLRLAGFFIVACGYLLFRNTVAGNPLGSILTYKGELILRILHIPDVLLMFLGILVFPYGLHYYRSTDILQPYFFSTAALIFFLGALVFLIKSLPRDSRRWLIFAGGWFFVTLLPVLNIVPLINEYSLILTAEHFLYLPMVGFVLFAFWLGSFVVRMIFKGRAGGVNVLLMSSLGLICMAATIKQNTYWRGEIPLFERVVRFEKNFGRGHLLLAKAYYFHQEYDRAIVEYEIALGIMQSYFKRAKVPEAQKFYLGFIQEIYFDLARCYEARDKKYSH